MESKQANDKQTAYMFFLHSVCGGFLLKHIMTSAFDLQMQSFQQRFLQIH